MGDKLVKAPVIKQGASFFADYRKFMDRGNVIDLAVAVVVGMYQLVGCCMFDEFDESMRWRGVPGFFAPWRGEVDLIAARMLMSMWCLTLVFFFVCLSILLYFG